MCRWSAAAVAASAAATAVASAACPKTEYGRRRTPATASEARFAPRYDGLRFIETLVTAHR